MSYLKSLHLKGSESCNVATYTCVILVLTSQPHQQSHKSWWSSLPWPWVAERVVEDRMCVVFCFSTCLVPFRGQKKLETEESITLVWYKTSKQHSFWSSWITQFVEIVRFLVNCVKLHHRTMSDGRHSIIESQTLVYFPHTCALASAAELPMEDKAVAYIFDTRIKLESKCF